MSIGLFGELFVDSVAFHTMRASGEAVTEIFKRVRVKTVERSSRIRCRFRSRPSRCAAFLD